MSKTLCSIVIIGYLLIASPLIKPAFGQTEPLPATGEVVINGSVIDASTRQPIPSATVSIRSQDGKINVQRQVRANGSYEVTVKFRQQYIIMTTAEGYAQLDEQFSFTETRVSSIHRLPTELFRVSTKPVHSNATAIRTAPPSVPPLAGSGASVAASAAPSPPPVTGRVIPPKTLDAKVVYTPPRMEASVGKTTQLRAIQFVQGKTEFLPEAQPALEQVLAFMREKPTVEIELAGHTDNQGDFDQNLLLSRQRVEAVKAYLVQNGIAASRITTRGYGPTRPIASNNSEVTRQLNRRVEMTVIKE